MHMTLVFTSTPGRPGHSTSETVTRPASSAGISAAIFRCRLSAVGFGRLRQP